MSKPNRWLHLRLRRPFSDAEFDCFGAHTEIWCKFVQATLAVWSRLGQEYAAPKYEFFSPELSAERLVATLPVGGEWTLGTRALFEDAHSHLLWNHFPIPFQMEAEEGITETVVEEQVTNWRPCLRAPGWAPPGTLEAADVVAILGAHTHPDKLSSVKRALLWVSGVLPGV